jgi:hypothetical protein
MLVKDNRQKAESILNDFWDGVSEVFNSGPLKSLESFDILYEQSPKAMKSFMDLQLSLHNDMPFKEFEDSIEKMKKAFAVVFKRYKNSAKEKNDSILEQKNNPQIVNSNDPFSDDLQSKNELTFNTKKDPFE